MRLQPDEVVGAINAIDHNFGLCGAFFNGNSGAKRYRWVSNVPRMLEALGGEAGKCGWFWTGYGPTDERLMMLAFLLTWAEEQS